MKLSALLTVLFLAGASPCLAQTTFYLGQVLILPLTFCPSNTVQTDGRLLPINQYQALFSLWGTRYGGDGITTFAVPNLKAPLSGNRQPMMSCVTLSGIYPAQS
jgi:microcystin-dependent protein